MSLWLPKKTWVAGETVTGKVKIKVNSRTSVRAVRVKVRTRLLSAWPGQLTSLRCLMGGALLAVEGPCALSLAHRGWQRPPRLQQDGGHLCRDEYHGLWLR
jgi:hypothetical protein